MSRKKFAQATVIMLALWWFLTGSADALYGRGWYVGLPMALLAGYLHTRLSQHPQTPQSIHLQWQQLPYFFWYFVSRSVVAGIDVAQRTLSPSMGLNDRCLDYPINLPEGPARVFFMLLISLLPGTLAVRQQATHIRLHVLDSTQNISAECEKTEAVVARLFGIKPQPRKDQL